PQPTNKNLASLCSRSFFFGRIKQHELSWIDMYFCSDRAPPGAAPELTGMFAFCVSSQKYMSIQRGSCYETVQFQPSVFSPDSTDCKIKVLIVIGPTPPGTGV